MFDECGAFASQLSAGDSLTIALVPAVFFGLPAREAFETTPSGLETYRQRA